MKTIISIMVTLLVVSCSNNKKVSTEEEEVVNKNSITLTPAQIKNAALSYTKLAQKEMASVLKVNGKVDVPPQNMISISVPLGGYLKTTRLLPGMHVRKGEVIAVVEDQQYIQLQQDYLLTKSRITYGQLEYDRQKELNQSKAASDKVLEQAAAELSSLQITMRGLTEKLRLIGLNPARITQTNISRSINVYAPINGFVSKVNVNIGKYIAPTDVMFELVNPSDIHLALQVFEKDINQLRIGQKVVAYTNNNTNKKYRGEILLIGKDITDERSTEVHCHFETYDRSLIPGTYMNAEIEIKAANSFVLPEKAVVSYEGKSYAFIKQSDSGFHMVEVQTGNIENGFIQILQAEGLADKTFVLDGAYSLLMSLKNVSEE